MGRFCDGWEGGNKTKANTTAWEYGDCTGVQHHVRKTDPEVKVEPGSNEGGRPLENAFDEAKSSESLEREFPSEMAQIPEMHRVPYWDPIKLLQIQPAPTPPQGREQSNPILGMGSIPALNISEKAAGKRKAEEEPTERKLVKKPWGEGKTKTSLQTSAPGPTHDETYKLRLQNQYLSLQIEQSERENGMLQRRLDQFNQGARQKLTEKIIVMVENVKQAAWEIKDSMLPTLIGDAEVTNSILQAVQEGLEEELEVNSDE